MEALAQIAAQLGMDKSTYYLFGIVAVFYLVLSAVYLKPFQRLFHERKLKTAGVKKEAEQLKTQAEEAMNQYRARLKDISDQSRTILRELEEQARKEESAIVGEASVKAKASIQNTQKELDSQRKATVEALSAEIAGIATDIASKAMGRPISAR